MTIFNETRERITIGNLTVYKQVTNFKNELQELYYYLINNKTSDSIIQNKSIAIANECESAYNYTEQWIYCNLNRKSIDIKDRINSTIYKEIIFPIEQTNISKTSKVKKNLSTIIENIESILYNLNFNILAPLKSDILESFSMNQIDIIMNQTDNIIKSFNEELKKFYLIIDNKIKELDVEIKDINKESLNLEEKRVDLNQKREHN